MVSVFLIFCVMSHAIYDTTLYTIFV